MAGQHPTDDLLDRTLGYAGAIEKSGRPAPVQALPAHPTDQLLDRLLPPASKSELGLQVNPVQFDPNADWDGMRQAFDAAVFGKYSDSDPDRAKAKKSWEAGHQKQAAAAEIIGSVAPGILLSTAAGQAVFRAGQVAEKLGAPALNTMAKFLTGTAEGNKLMRGLSSATWGAGQGAITGGYSRAMGQDSDVGGQAILGAAAGPLTNMIFAPYRSNIAPAVGDLARQWSANDLKLNASQLPGAPPILKLFGKLYGPHAVDMHDVTGSLMKTMGSADTVMTPGNIARARVAIRQSLTPISPTWNNSNIISDSEMVEKMKDALGAQGVLNPSEAALMRKAMAQWQNADIGDHIARNIGPDGIVTPKALTAAVRSAGTQGPVDPIVNSLAQGAPLFTKGEPAGATALKYGGGILGGAMGAEALTHAMPMLEQVAPHLPMLAHAGAAYAGANALVAPLALPLMATPLYRKLLTGGGVGPIANPLLPGLTQNQENLDKVSWMKDYVPKPSDLNPISPAQGAAGADAYTRRLFQIESSNDPHAVTGSNYGLGQFSKDQFADYGITDWRDPAQQTRAVAMERAKQGAAFSRVMGRDPTPGELYLMHQQGLAGGLAIMTRPDQPAWQAIRQYYKSDKAAQDAIGGNNPFKLDPTSVTGRQFSQAWINHFEQRPAGVQVAPGPTSSGFSSVLQPITGPGPSQDEITNALAGSQ